MFRGTPPGRFLRVNAAVARVLRYWSPEGLVARIRNIKEQPYVDRPGGRNTRAPGRARGWRGCTGSLKQGKGMSIFARHGRGDGVRHILFRPGEVSQLYTAAFGPCPRLGKPFALKVLLGAVVAAKAGIVRTKCAPGVP